MSGEQKKKEMNVVSFSRDERKPDPTRIAEFSATARKLLRERSAGDVVARLLRETPRDEWPRLAEREELRNSGALDGLSRAIAGALEKEPTDALAMSTIATSIAETLPAGDYPPIVLAQIRAHAWKDRAQALSYVGRDAEALEAIERAEALLDPFAAVAHDRAIVRLQKAIVLQHLKEWDASLELLVECRKVFASHKDSKRLLQCGMAEGSLHYRQGDYRRSHSVTEPLIDIARDANDLESLAAIHHNLASSLLRLGEYTTANIHFSEAVRYFNDSGRKIEGARAEMNVGKLFLRKGQIVTALPHLEAARNAFERAEMPVEVGMCGSLMMEAMLIRGDDAVARTIAAELATQLRGSRVSRQALEAIQYADHAIEAHDDAVAAVRHVHDYFDALREDPHRAFTAN